MKSIYSLYKDRLVGISGRSRSLYSKNISKKQAYNLGKLFEFNQEEAQNFVDFLWGGNRQSFRVLTDKQIAAYSKSFNADKARPVPEKELAAKEEAGFIALKREVEEIEKETGRYELFVGYPFVEGIIEGGVPVKAPLLLFPARINIDKGVEIEIIRSEPVQINKVFVLAYAREMRLSTADVAMDFDMSALPSVQQVREQLKKYNINLKYPSQKKAVYDIEKTKDLKSEDLEIRNFCVLGRFPLANSIYYDYAALEKQRLSSPILDALLSNKHLPPQKKKRGAEGVQTAHRLDFAQERAIEKINSEGSTVIYGPPGTGKSQTIAGVITDRICRGERVLAVSQKRAALDVIYSRLGKLNGKAVILPDPEKSKTEFYQRTLARHEMLMNYSPVFSEEEYRKNSEELAHEIAELKSLNDALFTPTDFGLNLQQMYAMSTSIGQNSSDYALYTAMKATDLIRMNYDEIYEAQRSILQRNKGKLYYDHLLLSVSNPLIEHIKTDLDVLLIGKVRTFLTGLINKEHMPFNVSAYRYSRYMLVYSLERRGTDSTKHLADMIVRTENPALAKGLKAASFPLFWIAYPFVYAKYAKKRREVSTKLAVAGDAVKHFVNEFELLSSVLEPEGLALIVDSIAFGNDKFLRKLLAALDDYISVRAMNIAVKDMTVNERKILTFVKTHTKTRAEFFDALGKVLSIRIYHEVLKEEKDKEQILSKSIVFSDLRTAVMRLKDENKQLVLKKAADKFCLEYKELFNSNIERSKNFYHQISKQKNIWPVRRLMEHFEDYLMKMFPCWLLSPEAVSSILPLKKDLFDVVVFDEASQVFIESTVPTIYRGRSLVVAGDNKQLKPTSVFIKRYLGDDTYSPETDLNTQTVMEVDSLLDLASSRLAPSHLTYHYRSKYEELINFSNYAFYEGRLQVAPNISKNKDYRPIERIMVSGRWINRRNTAEAKAVVELVKKIFKARKNNESIGIVTFNTEQEEHIKDMLDAESCKSDAFRRVYLSEKERKENGEDSGIFVKNLENVQGDERDIIIFSVAYAKNEENKVNAQFGTLSLAGGENRLNVAITRAKQKVYIVTSVEPEEFTTADAAKNNGPKLLKKYLQYARAVSNKKEAEAAAILGSLLTIPKKTIQSLGAFELSLRDELVKLGYQVDVNLGNADYKLSLGVFDKTLERYVLGLECDYTAFSSSQSMLERDVYRCSFFESRGWRIMRIWSRDWWLGKNVLIKSIQREIENARKALYDELSLETGAKLKIPKPKKSGKKSEE